MESDFVRIAELNKKRPHLVILGAGASMAAIPNGDKNGRKSSVMKNFIKNLGLSHILSGLDLKTKSKNVEDIYSELFVRTDKPAIKARVLLENEIRNYFSKLEIPDYPTVYDYLILSLTDKDCIATFNWDSLLLQAYKRVSKVTDNLPKLAFLHGNVGVGLCPICNNFGHKYHKCSCGKSTFQSDAPILYPVAVKDYKKDSFISNEWEKVKHYISKAAVITIFGYSAPKTDAEAINLLLEGFHNFGTDVRKLDRIQIIDLIPEGKEEETYKKIYRAWQPFIKTMQNHINIYDSFNKTLLAEFPRRSIEGFTYRYIHPCHCTTPSNVSFSEAPCETITDIGWILEPALIDESNGIYEIFRG